MLIQHLNELLASLANPYLFIYDSISEAENFSQLLPTRNSHWALSEKIGGKTESSHRTPVCFYPAEANTDGEPGLPTPAAHVKENKHAGNMVNEPAILSTSISSMTSLARSKTQQQMILFATTCSNSLMLEVLGNAGNIH